MRPAANFLKCLSLMILIISAHLFQPFLRWAQAKGPVSPKVSLTIFLVPEKEACKPSGYRDHGDETTNCQPLELEDIEKWRKLGVISQTVKIPPSEISLDKLILGILDLYVRDYQKTADKRLSAVFLFQWDTPQQSSVLLKRNVGPKYSNIPVMEWPGELKDKKYWIHQERVDALLPAYNINWILKAGNNLWRFNFIRK